MCGTHRLPVAVSEERGDGTPGDLRALVDDLVGRVEALHADVANLQSAQSAAATASTQVPTTKRTLPSEGEPIDLAVLAEWVESLQVRYAAAGDWLRPCWWRHGFVVEELAALRVAWLAVYDTKRARRCHSGSQVARRGRKMSRTDTTKDQRWSGMFCRGAQIG